MWLIAKKVILLLCAILWSTQSHATIEPSMQNVYSLFLAGEKEKAHPLLISLVERKCPEPDAYLYLGVLERGKKHYADAIRIFNSGLSQNKTHAGLLSELATTYAWSGKLDEAVATYDNLLKAHPDHMGGTLGRARVLLWSGNFHEALEVYQQVLENEPNQIEALRGVASVYRTRMQFKKAKIYYSRALAIDTNDLESKQGLEAINRETRWEAQAGAGMVSFEGAEINFTGTAFLSYIFNPELRLYAGYKTEIPSGIGTSSGEDPGNIAHEGKIGTTYRFTNRFTFDGHYGLRYHTDTFLHRLGLRGSIVFSKRWVALVGVRPEYSQEGRFGTLADTGIQFIINPKIWLMAQLFGYMDTENQKSASAIGTFSWWPVSYFSMRVGAGGGLSNKYGSLSAYASTAFHFTKNTELRLQYDYMQIPDISIRRHGANATMIVRF